VLTQKKKSIWTIHARPLTTGRAAKEVTYSDHRNRKRKKHSHFRQKGGLSVSVWKGQNTMGRCLGKFQARQVGQAHQALRPNGYVSRGCRKKKSIFIFWKEELRERIKIIPAAKEAKHQKQKK